MIEQRVTVSVKYEAGHSYLEDWVKTEYYCPHCGKQEVWDEDSGGDHYVGTRLTCVSCAAGFRMPESADATDWQTQQRIEAIKGTVMA